MTYEQDQAQKEMVDAIAVHDDTGKAMREAAANVGVDLERERLRQKLLHLRTEPPFYLGSPAIKATYQSTIEVFWKLIDQPHATTMQPQDWP